MQKESCYSEEAHLRSALQDKPQNGKIMSKLATLMAARAKADNNLLVHGEAMLLAKRAIETVPHKPFGYAALSSISHDYQERMQSLRKAIELSCDSHHKIPRVAFMVRFLIEPRSEEARKIKGKLGKASVNHPSRTDLDEDESVLYGRICESLDEAWSMQLTDFEKEALCENEYKLG